MKNNTVPLKGVRKIPELLRTAGRRIYMSILRSLFPALRAPDFLTPPPYDVMTTSRRMLFTNPIMARAILQHRRPEACCCTGEQEKPLDPLWDPFGYGHFISLN